MPDQQQPSPWLGTPANPQPGPAQPYGSWAPNQSSAPGPWDGGSAYVGSNAHQPYAQPLYAALPTGGSPVALPPANAPGPERSGLAVIALVLAGIALLGVVGLVFAVANGGADDGGYGPYGPTRGTLAPAVGGGLTGAALAAEVSAWVIDGGGSPQGVQCPATARVAQDVTTVCHGDIDGDEWAFVVFFEDVQGDYTLLEI